MTNYTRPANPYRKYNEPEAEDTFTVVIHFKDDAETVTVAEVPENDLMGVYQTLGDADGRIQVCPQPGTVYMTAANRVKHIIATKEASK